MLTYDDADHRCRRQRRQRSVVAQRRRRERGAGRLQGQAWRAREVSEGEANGCTGLWTAGASDRAGGRGGPWNTGTRNRGPSPSGDRDTTDSADYYSIIIYVYWMRPLLPSRIRVCY